MNLHLLVLGILAMMVIGVLLAAVPTALHRRQLRKQRGQQQTIYAVGSLEDNARVVEAIRKLNERLAKDGKRVPERTAMDIIQQRVGEHGKPQDQA